MSHIQSTFSFSRFIYLFRSHSSRSNLLKPLLHFVVLVMVLLISGDLKPSQAQYKPAIPVSGAYAGVALGGQMKIAEFNNLVGTMQGMSVEFFNFPKVIVDPYVRDDLELFLAETRDANAVPLVTLETFNGMSSYTTENVRAIADLFAQHRRGILIRWNHEMNGPWYPWGQQPDLYREKFREFALIMKQYAPNVAMVWAPNQGTGYPFGNASITNLDPYTPYYPGDDVVDWVGMSYYHRGWSRVLRTLGNNILPEGDAWIKALRGDGLKVPDFYGIFAVQKKKPMIIPETSALYRESLLGASEWSIKDAWFKQVYNLSSLPQIKAFCWFNVRKNEPDFNEIVPWEVTSNSALRSRYAEATSDTRWAKGSDYVLFRAPPPTSMNRGVAYSIPLQYAASGDRDIKISLFQVGTSWTWKAGAQTQVQKGYGQVAVTLNVPGSAALGSNYVIEIMTKPRGGAWYSRFHYDQAKTSLK